MRSKPGPGPTSFLGRRIAATDEKLAELESDINELGQPAGNHLRRRLAALKIEERALQRNYRELRNRGMRGGPRKKRLEALLHHVEREESSVEHEAAFLSQAAPSSIILAAETGARVARLFRKGISRLLGNHHPLGSSVFVNHTHDDLVNYHGLQEEQEPKDLPK